MSNAMRSIANAAFSPRYLFFTNTALGATFYTAEGAMAGGGLIFGALGHHWYAFLDRKFPGIARKIMTKKLMSEAAAGPPFALMVFMIVGNFEGKSHESCWNDFKRNLWFLCAADWGFYVPLQFFNFYYLPPKYRFLYVAAITLVYDTVLAYLLHRPSSKTQLNPRMEDTVDLHLTK